MALPGMGPTTHGTRKNCQVPLLGSPWPRNPAPWTQARAPGPPPCGTRHGSQVSGPGAPSPRWPQDGPRSGHDGAQSGEVGAEMGSRDMKIGRSWSLGASGGSLGGLCGASRRHLKMIRAKCQKCNTSYAKCSFRGSQGSQVTPQMRPKCAQDGPRWTHVGPKMAEDGVKMRGKCPDRADDADDEAQDAAQQRQDGLGTRPPGPRPGHRTASARKAWTPGPESPDPRPRATPSIPNPLPGYM